MGIKPNRKINNYAKYDVIMTPQNYDTQEVVSHYMKNS